MEAYKKCTGNLEEMIEYIPLATSYDLDRFVDKIDKAIELGDVPDYSAYARAKKRIGKIKSKLRESEEKEAKEFEKVQRKAKKSKTEVILSSLAPKELSMALQILNYKRKLKQNSNLIWRNLPPIWKQNTVKERKENRKRKILKNLLKKNFKKYSNACSKTRKSEVKYHLCTAKRTRVVYK